jgi:hypothetical protein
MAEAILTPPTTRPWRFLLIRSGIKRLNKNTQKQSKKKIET